MGASAVLRRLLARRVTVRSSVEVAVPESDSTAVYIFIYRDRSATDPNTAWRYSIEPVERGCEPLASGTGRTENAALANAHARAQGLRLDNVVAVHWGVDRQAWERQLSQDITD